MTSWEKIKKANESIKTTEIKGKNYAEVNQRIKAFRMVYPTGQIITEMLSNESGICVFRAMVYDEADNLLATGTAYEKESSSFINKTSYIENCETSAVGRALGMAGFGIDVSVASYEEVANAIHNQEDKPKESDDEMESLLLAVKNAQIRMDELGIDYRNDKKVVSWIIAKSGVETADVAKMTVPMMKDILVAYNSLIKAKEKTKTA